MRTGMLLMDGIFVAESARGLGIGSALLDQIWEEARQMGCKDMRLDVIDTNPRARALKTKTPSGSRLLPVIAALVIENGLQFR